MYKNKIFIGTDTVSGIAPEILESISLASRTKTLPYGNDSFTVKCQDIVREIFEKNDLEIMAMIFSLKNVKILFKKFLKKKI